MLVYLASLIPRAPTITEHLGYPKVVGSPCVVLKAKGFDPGQFVVLCTRVNHEHSLTVDSI
jgi:hypothetical protein